MINVLRIYCGKSSRSDMIRYDRRAELGPVVAYNCTGRCNLTCPHCYCDAGPAASGRELTTGLAKELLSQLRQACCPVVLFSGGEPLARPDIYELLDWAGRLGLATAISTNGTLIDAATAQTLSTLGVRYVGISLDGPQPFHDQFRGKDGSSDKAIAGMESCLSAGLRVGIRFTITACNGQYVPWLFELAADMGIRRLCFYHLVRSGRARHMQAPSTAQTRSIVDTIADMTARFAARFDEVLTVGNHADGPYLLIRMAREGNPNLDRAWHCLKAAGGNRSGIGIACIDPQGNVYADQFWRNYSLGNITERTFGQIWSDTDHQVLNRIRQKHIFGDQRCLACTWVGICKGNFRFLAEDPSDGNWLNEPPCYLTDAEVCCRHPGPLACEANKA